MHLIADLQAALMLLTRLPVSRLAAGRLEAPDMGRAVWAYPLVGLLVGGLAGLVDRLCLWLAMPAALAACWTLAASLLLTGALHEDGLADSADALGGATPQARLAIMRDSRIGGYGALALAMSLAVRGCAIAALPGRIAALALAAGLGRGAILVLLACLPPARGDGVAAGLRPRPGSLAAGLAVSLAAALLLHGTGALAAALVTALATALIVRRLAGGHSGDTLGAASVLTECVALSVLAAR